MIARRPIVITAPAREPLTLEEVKDHLRVDGSDSDLMLLGTLRAARQYLEAVTGRAFITRTLDAYYDAWPAARLRLPQPPLQSVTAVYYTDENGVEQTLSAAVYQVETVPEPGEVVREHDQSWPTLNEGLAVVRVRLVAGFGDAPADVPEPLRQAMLFQCQALYDSDPRTMDTLGAVIDTLIAPYVVRTF